MAAIQLLRRPGPASPWAVLAVLCTSVFVIVVDGTIVNVALPTLVRELGADNGELQWIVDAYVLVFAGLLIVAGSLGDRFGRRGSLVSGMVVFALCSAMAAHASTPGELIAWRAAMGVGAALIFPATLAILVNVFTDARQRSAAIAVWAATAGIAVAVGPIAGGWLLEHFWWGSVFMVNVPVIAGAVAAIVLLVPTSRDATIHRFDPTGTVLSIVGIVVVVWAIIEAPDHGWGSATTLLALAAGLAVLVLFALWERRSDHPMLEVAVFRDMRFTASSLAVTFSFFALMGFVFMITQYFQFVRGYSAFEAGLRTLPFAAFMGAAAPLSTKLAERFGTKVVVSAGLVAMSAGFGWVTLLGAHSSYAIIVGQMFCMGGGLGLVNAPATEAIMGSLPPAKAGVGSAVNDTARELGGTLGVAVIGSLFASAYASRLGELLGPSALPPAAVDQAKESVGAAVQITDIVGQRAGPEAGRAMRLAVEQSFTEGLHLGAAAAALVVLAAAVVAALFLPTRARIETQHSTEPSADPALVP